MRYTTIIDISEFPLLYRNQNARLVYLHLVLKCGYHDDDRDMILISLRRLADDVGISLSALRNALSVLGRYKLVTFKSGFWIVNKFVLEKSISKRAKSQRQQQEINAIEERNKQSERMHQERENEKRKRQELAIAGLSEFIVFYERKYKEWIDGDAEALVSLKRHRNFYLQECERMKHDPLRIED